MSMSVHDLETAITQLPPSDLAQLATWFEEFQARAWDKQIEEDAEAGRLDELVQQAEEEFEAEQYRSL